MSNKMRGLISRHLLYGCLNLCLCVGVGATAAQASPIVRDKSAIRFAGKQMNVPVDGEFAVVPEFLRERWWFGQFDV